ncbi:MAG: F0F1 ATP synthase subunit delta [Candidatus Dasytiphilus stammeri]
MSHLFTIARPYGKAAFEFAQTHKIVEDWQSMLSISAEVSLNKQVTNLATVLAPKTLAIFFINICGLQNNESFHVFIEIIAENKRLVLLPEILKIFIRLRTIYYDEMTEEIEVIVAHKLSKNNLEKIKIYIEKNISRKSKIHFRIDKKILSGIIIRIGDTIIDGSIRGRIDRLSDILQC